ncbi:MAG: hypothetical protein KJN99_00505, partial [Marinicaulis sp.]|nr:hypothetical protein [Marinicaulis sp.]
MIHVTRKISKKVRAQVEAHLGFTQQSDKLFWFKSFPAHSLLLRVMSLTRFSPTRRTTFSNPGQ